MTNAFNNDVEQRTLDWHRQRLGAFTGSKVGKLMGASRKKDEVFGATAMSYIYEVAAERMLNPAIVENDIYFDSYIDQNNVTTKAMQWGIDNEPDARNLLSKILGVEIMECPSISHPTIPHFSSSPDGYIADGEERGTVEIKVVGNANFGKYALEMKSADDLKAINPEYYYQCFSHMIVTGASYCQFFVYNPYMKPSYVTIRIERDEDVIKQIEERVILANSLIDEKLGQQ